ncbi:TFIIE alpha subunit-domain-containing protein [Melanogaster broomeanus]|nr:TFIIE alpha subunit-domain-containing protein [Melanogaster broomeanus]
MATKDEQDVLRLLVQHVARGFYEPKYVIILDQLARHAVLKDDDLAGRMGLQAKELNKLMAVLGNDRLVHVYRQNELKEGAQRSVGRQYYYIDYKHFCDVVKWRIAEMRRIIDSNLRNELDNRGYICPQCGKSYAPLEVDRLMQFDLGDLRLRNLPRGSNRQRKRGKCQGSQDRMQRFNQAMRFVIEGLRRTESMVLPALDVPLWIKNNVVDADKQKTGQSSGLKVAGSSGRGRQDEAIGIVMSMDKDETTRRQERDAEAAAKRQQNVLPAKVHERMASSSQAIPASGDESLKGLGTMGPSRLPQVTLPVEDVKPEINHEADYYEQYYATRELEEEEELKPSVQYLDSLNGYRKRSRSQEDEGAAAKKLSKLEAEPPVTNGADELPQVEEPAGDGPLIFVNGVQKPFSEVTEEDQELMTPDEYTAYFEVLQAHS